jgi:hypothetical protein
MAWRHLSKISLIKGRENGGDGIKTAHGREKRQAQATERRRSGGETLLPPPSVQQRLLLYALNSCSIGMALSKGGVCGTGEHNRPPHLPHTACLGGMSALYLRKIARTSLPLVRILPLGIMR